MISKEASLFFAKIANNIIESGYVIKEWSEIFGLLGQEGKKDEKTLEMWEQIKFYGYVEQKFKDDEQVCFAITDKGRLFAEELKAVVANVGNEVHELKIDHLGRPIAISSQKFFKRVASFFKRKWVDIVLGLASGLVGGLIGGACLIAFIK